MPHDAQDIIGFWFMEIGSKRWFEPDATLDRQIHDTFLDDYERAAAGELQAWQETPEGMLALMLLLDQFPRRMFRGTSRAFATDHVALELARDAIIKHFDDRIPTEYKLLFYLPFLNSESEGNQRLALFYIRERIKENHWLSLAEHQFDVVQRFGRFPDRNPILGREPTPAEIAFVERQPMGNA